MSSRPHLPKKLAATIRRVQGQVTSARYAVLCYEKLMHQHESRIVEFEADPTVFAAQHYRGHEVDSYPVQTNISQCRAGIEYYRSEMAFQEERLRLAELELRDTIATVLTKVSSMRPSRGRVPWPPSLPGFDILRKTTLKRWEREALADEAWRVREQEKYQRLQDAEDARAAIQAEREFERARAEIQELRARMSPEEREAEEAGSKALIAALKAGTITFSEILAYLRSCS